ncbi:conserved protein of unknown function [Thermococcus nautili]|uniref:hypothetical protein n=1 Tax=Thermococcus nautili TaxID=195522 RepID=UPI002557257A|nr:hypothetical protein [Thermococcus nautili]CAI1493616.1 conserved protein of unknown function [Thermococcus nautili]
MPGAENIAKWFNAAEIDYFSAFIKLWLSFNAWYRNHYSEEYIKKDRDYINVIRGIYVNHSQNLKDFDRTDRNIIRKKFLKMITLEQNDIEAREFRRLMEKFMYLFKDYPITGHFNGQTKETKTLEEFFLPKDKSTRAIRMGLTQGKFFSFGEAPDKFSEGDLVIKNDLEKLYSYTLEIIYQMRNSLVHGDLSYDQWNHERIKYCYLILYYLMKEVVK